MVLQTRYPDKMDLGPVGAFADTDKDRDTLLRLNDDPRAKQTEEFTIDSAVDDTAYTVTLDGFDVTYTSAESGATTSSIAGGLRDAINADPNVNGRVEATVSGSTVVVKAFEGGLAFTASESDSNISLTQTTPNAEAKEVPFGRGLVEDGYSADSATPMAKLADEAALTKRKLDLAVDSVQNSTEYAVSFEKDGTMQEASFTSDASATGDEITNGLKSALDALGVSGVTFTADTGNDKVVIEAETAGVCDFTVNAHDTTLLTLSEVEKGDCLDDKFVGVAIRTAEEGDKYPPQSQMTVAQEGSIYVPVEESISAGDDVYVRLAANGDNDELGKFRKSYENGAAPLEGATFERKVDSNLAIIDLDL